MYQFLNGNPGKGEEILKKLREYPHCGQLKDIDKVTGPAFRSLRSHLEEELKAGYKTSLQTAQTRNLFAFSHFQLGETEKALEETDGVLQVEDQTNNIVSLANKVFMLTKLQCYDEAEEVLDKLTALKAAHDYDYLLVRAKGELAANYLRFGLMFKEYAIDAYKEVIAKARSPEVWIWKLGLAVAYRQALSLQYAPYAYASSSGTVIDHKDALNLLREITVFPSKDEEADANIKANAYAEMGLLLWLVWDRRTKDDLCRTVESGVMACCKKALRLDGSDPSVLWKTGKLFRNHRDLRMSKKLLEKSLEIRHSSAAFHNLGLTLKARVTSFQHGKMKTRRGGKRQKERRGNAEKKAQAEAGGDAARSKPPEKTRTAASATRMNEVTRVKKIVKSPPAGTTKFDPEDSYVQEVIKNLQCAVTFSNEENSRALYDLALMFSGTGQREKALRHFKMITRRGGNKPSTPAGRLELITAYDQIGVIYKEMAGNELDPAKKKEHEKRSIDNFYETLVTADKHYSKVPEIRNRLEAVLQSPSALLRAIEASSDGNDDKQKEMARTLNLINKAKQSLAALDKIPQERLDASHIYIKLKNFMKFGEYQKVAYHVAYLKLTDQRKYAQLLQLSQRDDERFLFNIHFQAGVQSLKECSFGGNYFERAFRKEMAASTSRPTSSEARAAATQEEENCIDILLLHDIEDEDIKHKASKLKEILQDACGLCVVRRHENVLVGPKVESILKNVEDSRLVVVLPGKKEVTPEFDFCVTRALVNKPTKMLLTDSSEGDTIPDVLRSTQHRQMQCPAMLFADEVSAAGPYTEDTIKAISQLFQFLCLD